jgi:hypothetical protein
MTYAKYPAPSKLAAHWFGVDGDTAVLYPLDFFGDSTDTFSSSPQEFQDITKCVVEGVLLEVIVNGATVELFKASDTSTALLTLTLETATGPLPLYVPFGDPGIFFDGPFAAQVSNAGVQAHFFYRIISTSS